MLLKKAFMNRSHQIPHMKTPPQLVIFCALSLAMPAIAANPLPTKALTSVVKGSIDLDAAPLTGGAEIPAFDPVSRRAFTSSNTGIHVVDLTNPAAPAFVQTIAPAALAVVGLTSNDVSSVAVRKGTPSILAAAVINTPRTSNGHVVFLNAATGALLGSAVVGVVPDNITFTPDGTKLLVANEGELDGTSAVIPDSALGTVSIIDLANIAAPVVTTADFTAYDAPGTIATLKADGVRIFANGLPSSDFEPEYIAVSPDSTKAMVTLQEANAVGILDIATATFTSVKALGKKNYAVGSYDFSDRDGPGATQMINFVNGRPVFGLYMPDAIAAYNFGGQTYYVTANEGDDRNDFLTPDETTTVGNASYVLDPTVFPNAATLKDQAVLGRLTVSNATGLRGDTDNDGDVDEILSYGGRSFSILDSTGSIIFDSGDMIDQIVAFQHPSLFDDGRSDNKGSEPEGVTVASVGGRTYAFVGLERSKMTLVFDVTNPASVTYTTSLINPGDENPEGLVVVSAADSPTGRPLVLVANEVSQTLTIFELITDKVVVKGSTFSYAVSFSAPNGAPLTYSATLADNSPLPTWLTINPTTGLISGSPASSDVGNLSIKVTATDGAAFSISETFTIRVLSSQEDMLPVSRTSGVVTQKVASGKTTLLGLPNVKVLASGTVAGVSGNNLTLSSAVSIASLGSAPKAIKITSRVNQQAGSTNAYGISARITASSGETVTAALSTPPNVGDEFIIYQLNTIASLFGATNTAGLTAAAAPGTADILYLTNEGALVGYFYNSSASKWRLLNDPSGADQNNTIIEPTAGAMIVRRSAGLPEIFIRLSGEMLPGRQVARLGGSGFSIINNPFFISTTLGESGLASSLNGGSGPGTADILYLEEAGELVGYYYKNSGLGGTGWRTLGDGSTDQGDVILSTGKAFLLKDQVGTAGFILPEPFAE
jgi:hypothetical protein